MPAASPPDIERWPQGSLMCTLGGSRREKQKRRRRRRKKKNKKKKKQKGRPRPSSKTEAASACRNNLLTGYQIRTDPSKVAPGAMYEPSAWQQTAAWKGTRWKRREVAPREVDVQTRWKSEREAEDKRRRRSSRRRRRGGRRQKKRRRYQLSTCRSV